MLNNNLCIHGVVKVWAEQTPTQIAIMAPERCPLTYRSLYQQIDYVRKALRALGIKQTDHVATMIPNGPEAAVAFIAISSSTTIAPLNPAYRPHEIDFYLSILKAKAFIVHADIDPAIVHTIQKQGIPLIRLIPLLEGEAGLFMLEGESQEEIRTDLSCSGDVALLLHTSGTTAKPKLVPLTHANLCHSARHIQRALQLTASDCCLDVMPLFHIHGLVGGILSSLTAGASIVCPPGFYAPRFFEWLEIFRPTWYTAVPTMHQAILERIEIQPRNTNASSLRFIRSSSSALPAQLMANLEKVFGVPVIEAYGMTEASHQIASNPLPPDRRKVGSVGRAAGPEVAILGEEGVLLAPNAIGEIVIRGPNVTRGYEDNPPANKAAFTDGWFRTGDQGYIDEDGYIFLTGRLKELINRGGEKISPHEIDKLLLSHPAIAQAITFAIPHEKLGEEVGAAVVLHPQQTVTEREIREFAAQHLAAFKVPRYVVFLHEIPKGPTGKPLRIGLHKALGISSFKDGDVGDRTSFSAPRTALEALLTEIWSQVLNLESVSVHANFLALGGDSVLATQITTSIKKILQLDLSISTLFEDATIARLAFAIERKQAEQSKPARLFSLLAQLDALPEEEAKKMIDEKKATPELSVCDLLENTLSSTSRRSL